MQTCVELLGHMVTGATDNRPTSVAPQSKKIDTVAQWPVPKSAAHVRSFLGLAGYYRKFGWHFSEKATPLTELTKNGVKFEWGEEQQRAFDDIKTALTSAPLLALPDVEGARDGSRPFRVDTDASDKAMGAVLSQDFGDGYQPVAYASRSFSPAERNYNTT